MDKPQVDSNTLWPGMMQKTRLLILDYDVTRYHSFDLFRYLLWSSYDTFKQCDPKYLPMLTVRDLTHQILFYSRNCDTINPYDNFSHTRGTVDLKGLEDHFQVMFADTSAKIVPTDISIQYDTVFHRPNIHGYLLRFKNDPHKPVFYDKVTVYESEHILDLRMAFTIVQKHNINAVMISSVDLAVLLAEKLLAAGNRNPISFIIGSYFYNYDPELKTMRHLDRMELLEYKLKHEFGVFDSFSSLSYKQRVEGAASDE